MSAFSHDDIVRLSPAERLSLIGDLWDSLGDGDLPLPQAQLTELERRLDTFDEDMSSAVTWQQFKAKLSARSS